MRVGPSRTVEVPVPLTGVNAFGQVTGFDNGAPGGSRALLYTADRGMVDLNDLLLPTGSGWPLWAAYGMNDAGQITGFGKNPDGASHAFLLSPVH